MNAATTTMSLVEDNANLYESLALRGDLSGLSAADKTQYYKSLCERLGLDPATQPFIPLKLNGKEILYASRGCTDQLARLHQVNRLIVSREEINGVYLIVCEASLPNGRSEQSTGAVSIGGQKGDQLANSLMKCETKAKRRATLSLLGLGMLDESELETIPQYAQAPTKAQLVAQAEEPNASDALKRIRVASMALNDIEDSITWNTSTLAEYSQQLFDDENIKSSGDLTDEQLNFLAEDLEERLRLVKDNK
jgi:hypothetical protein